VFSDYPVSAEVPRVGDVFGGHERVLCSADLVLDTGTLDR
jgi:hypothetical protein